MINRPTSSDIRQRHLTGVLRTARAKCLLLLGFLVALPLVAQDHPTVAPVSTVVAVPPVAPVQNIVLTGADVLNRNDFKALAGKRVGLITNPTGYLRNGDSTVAAMKRSKNVQLVALYGPEHGVYGDQAAGVEISSEKDPRTGLPAYSLYGKTRKPTPEMLKGIDVLVYDIQDIGNRSYTYISTLGLAMEAAGEANIEFVVLDRPNPLSGNRVEGPMRDPNFTSFVSQWPIPNVYGLTPGELARMIAGEKWIKSVPKLTVIKMENWKRDMVWEDTTLAWVPTSPHIPTPESAYDYSVTGWMGELGVINNGVGYPQPFALVGVPNLSAEEFAYQLNRRHLPGIWFRPAYFTPFYTPQKGQMLGGAQIYYNDLKNVNLSATGLYIFEELIKESHRDFFKEATKESVQMFDRVAGSDLLRKELSAGKSAESIIHSWEPGIEEFLKKRAPYLLYE